MSDQKAGGLIRRNTAVAASSLVEQRVTSLLGETTQEGSYLFSFDPTVGANEELVYAAEGRSDKEWSQFTTVPFMLQNWSAKRIALLDTETDQTTPHVRVTLIDPDMDTLSFVSVGAIMSLDLLRALRGDGPYDPPIPIVVVPQKTRAGFLLLTFRPQRKAIESKKKA